MDYISDQQFENIDFAKDGFEQAEYSYCTFKQCNFQAVILSKSRFIDSTFEGCNLSNANIKDASFQNATFEQCKMLGLQFDTCTDFGFEMHCKNAMLQHAIFFKMDLTHCSFDSCNLSEADFGEADLSGITLSNCNLEKTIFAYTNLEKANLLGSVNFTIDPDNNKMKGARFSAAEVIRLLDKYGLDIE